MPTKCAITGTIVAPDGTPIPLAKVGFTPSDGRSAVGVRPLPPLSIGPEEAAATTDELGALEVELYPGQYSVRVKSALRAAFPTFQITVPDASAAVLSDIQNLAPPVPLNEAQLAVLAAQAARDEAVAARAGIEEAEGRAAQSAADADGSAQAAGASAGAAAGSAGAAGAAAGAAAGSAADAAADRTQTGQDRTAVAADRSEVEALRAAVAADRVETGEDRGAAAASAAAALGSENAAAGSAGDAAGSAAAAAASEEAAAQRASEAAADRTQTGQDRAATAADREQAAADRVATGEDRAATGADRTQTGEDRAATAADRVGTGEDRAAAAGSAAAALADRIAADAAVVAAQAARDAALLAAVPLGTEILWRSDLPFPAGWADTGSRLLSGTSERALLWNFSPLALFTGAAVGVWFDPYDLATLFQDASGSIPVTAAGQPDGMMLDKSKGLALGPEESISTVSASWQYVSSGTYQKVSPGWAALGPNIVSGIGKSFEVRFTITERTAGVIGLYRRNAANTGSDPVASGLAELNKEYRYVVTLIADASIHDIWLDGEAFLGTISGYSVRELPGYRATQTVAASRPTLARQPKGGRRNLLIATEGAPPIIIGSSFEDLGDGISRLTENVANGEHHGRQIVATNVGSSYFTALEVKRSVGVRNVRVMTYRSSSPFNAIGFVTLDLGNGGIVQGAASVVQQADGWFRIGFSGVAETTSVIFRIDLLDGSAPFYQGDGVSSILYRKPQLELGSVATPYQKVVSQYDVTEVGVRDCWHLYTDPVDDGLSVMVPAGGWTNATIMVALESGITVLTGQTIPAGAWALPLPRPSKCFGLVAVNRPLSAMETALLTRYLNLKRGAE